MATEPHDTRGIRDDASPHTVTPVTDVFETELGCTIIAELPGVAPDRLELSAERDTLTIRGRVSRPPRPPQHREFDLADYAQSSSSVRISTRRLRRSRRVAFRSKVSSRGQRVRVVPSPSVG